ncbi:hypothetical protein EII31_07240, partial [Leucobacter sp. OH2974_COT-288]
MNSIRKSYAASISILLSFLLTFVGFPYSIPNAAHAAENHADISVELEVPSTSVGGESFEFLAKLSNQGPDAADGTTFTVEFEPGTTELTLECDQQTVGTSCPTGFQIETQGSGSRPLITGRVDALPASGKVAFKLKGKFPNSSSASTLLKAELPAGIIDDNPSSNEVLQQTALRTLAPAVTVSKVQDLDVVAVGQERTYTVTYENTG